MLCAVKNGIAPVWASEIEAFPIKVTKHHFPNVKHLGDITKIKGDEIEPVDIIVGGSPCQDLSVAGKRAGMKHAELGDEETTRSGLFMEQIRIVREMRNATNKPRYMVWENVPGAFSSNNGEDFRSVLEETARVADPTVAIPRSVSWAMLEDLGRGFTIHGARSTLNTGEYPNSSSYLLCRRFWRTIQHPKYYLSAKACLGMLWRAKRGEKELPKMLIRRVRSAGFNDRSRRQKTVFKVMA